MIDERTGKDLKNYSILDEPMNYIYILLNSSGKIKIGKTTNIYQRYQSLCGSNGQGNKIESLYCSEPSYLYTLERIIHDKFSRYRIPNTEWFYDKEDPNGEILFYKACKELKLLFSSAEYERCNGLRKRLYKDKFDKEKGGEQVDH